MNVIIQSDPKSASDLAAEMVATRVRAEPATFWTWPPEVRRAPCTNGSSRCTVSKASIPAR